MTERRKKFDFAHQMRWLVDVAYPDAECIEVVLDNLNTHTYAALYPVIITMQSARDCTTQFIRHDPVHS